MGQYYTATVIDGRDDDVQAFRFIGYMKLMEHSFLTNELTDRVYREIADHPCRIAWIGDYSDEYDDRFGSLSHRTSMKLFEKVELMETVPTGYRELSVVFDEGRF